MRSRGRDLRNCVLRTLATIAMVGAFVGSAGCGDRDHGDMGEAMEELGDEAGDAVDEIEDEIDDRS